jgi:hypothetical protein
MLLHSIHEPYFITPYIFVMRVFNGRAVMARLYPGRLYLGLLLRPAIPTSQHIGSGRRCEHDNLAWQASKSGSWTERGGQLVKWQLVIFGKSRIERSVPVAF